LLEASIPIGGGAIETIAGWPGTEILRLIRQGAFKRFGNGHDLKAVILTMLGMEEQLEEIAGYNPDQLLVKPMEIYSIVEACKKAINQTAAVSA